MAAAVKEFPAKYGRAPHLVVVLVCDDPAAEELRVATYRYFKDIERENLISK